MTGAAPQATQLRRVIGVPGIAFTAFNSIVGVGIFGLPAHVAQVLGPAAILAYLVCLGLVGLIALCFAELGSRIPQAGGIYSFALVAFGPVVGGVAGMLWLGIGCIAAGATVARFFLDTLAQAWPALAGPWAQDLVLVAFYMVLVVINIRGSRDGSRITVGVGFAKLVPLLLLVILGAFAIHPAFLVWPALPSVARIGEGSVALFFAFMGTESCLNIAGEAANPARTIPRAIGTALVLVAVLYLGLQIVAQGVLGPALTHSAAPLTDTAGALFGAWGARLMVFMIALSAGGYIVADMLASPRVGYELAMCGQLPRWLGALHPRFGTPSRAIALYAVAVVVLAATGTFRELVLLSVSGMLLLYLISALALLRLRVIGIAQVGEPFRAPGGQTVPLMAAAICIWLLSTLAWPELFATMGFVAVTAAIFSVLKTRGAASSPPQRGGD